MLSDYITIGLHSSAPNFRLTLTAGPRRPLYRKDPLGGGLAEPGPRGEWSIKASETSSQFHSLTQETYCQHLTIDQASNCLSTSSHAILWVPIAKISIDLALPIQLFSMDFSRPYLY